MPTTDASDSILVPQTTTAGLLAKVLWITTVGFLFTAFGSWLAPPLLGFSWFVIVILNFGLIIAIGFAARHSPPLRATLLSQRPLVNHCDTICGEFQRVEVVHVTREQR